MSRYTTVSVEVGVDVDRADIEDDVLSEFDDSAIEDEYNSRGLGDQPSESEDREELMAIRQLVLSSKSKEAYRRMYDYIRNRLGTAI